MSITDELFDLVNPATTDTAAGRIFIANAPDNYSYVGPYMVIRGVGGISEEDLTGGIGLATERFEFSCRAKVVDGGNKTCRLMADEVRLAIQGFIPDDDDIVRSASHQSKIDLYDLDLNLHVRATDFEVMYSEQPTTSA